jgi:hypothetical protein
MLAGKRLKGKGGAEYWWEDRGEQGVGFWRTVLSEDGKPGMIPLPVVDFSGLYEGLA